MSAMKRVDAAERTYRAIAHTCHSGLDSRSLREEALRRLRVIVPFEAAFFATADPATLLYTGAVREGIPASASPRFVENELLKDDVNKFALLARAALPVATLGDATGGSLARSPRYQEILASLGLGDELRAALRTGATCWGYLCLHRERTSPLFTSADVAYVKRLAPVLAEGLRTALLLDQGLNGPDQETPGVLLLADDCTVVGSTPAAEHWLAEVAAEDWPSSGTLPRAVLAVAARAQALERMAQRSDEMTAVAIPLHSELPARARLHSRSGRWLVVHAARLSGPTGAGQTAVVLELARPTELAPLILQTHGLTAREGQVTQYVIRGLTTGEIADELAVSPLTVQQHLKAIFDKVGVRSRRELTSQVFAGHFRAGFLPDTSGSEG